MKLTPQLEKIYSHERLTAIEAQRRAQEIAFGPIVFQVSRLMVKFGILELLSNNREGLTQEQIAEKTGLSLYAAQVLLEASLSIGTVLIKEDMYQLSKTGWFLLNCRKRLISTHPKRGYPFTFHALYPNGDAKLVIIFYFRMVCHCFLT